MQSKVRKIGVEVVNTLPQGVYLTMGDPHLMEQVFVNLVSNACDAMAESKERQLAIEINPSTRRGQPCWKCDVIDTGMGIPKNLQQEIFGPFYTTKDKGKGTGLGLSIVRGILEDHKGDIEVISEPGKGSVFSLYLIQGTSSRDD
jgi:signal transduction histidine kinase